jgi:hypothetical protein
MSAANSQIMNYLVRMVVPMRREFGRNLDVEHFLHDGAYAREVLQHARGSQDPRLRDYAAHVEKALRHEGDAAAMAGGTMPADPDTPAAAPPAGTPETDAQEEEALRAIMLKKYVGGLR